MTILTAAVAVAFAVTGLPADASAQRRRGGQQGGSSGGGQAVARPPAGRGPTTGGGTYRTAPGSQRGPVYRPGPGIRPHYRPYPYYRSSLYFDVMWGGYPYYWAPYWYGYPWWGGPYYYYGYRGGYAGSSLKTEVKPKDTEIYVDGHYAGIADDFDGFFQSLAVEPGGHEISMYKDGFKRANQNIYFEPGETFKLKWQMVPLAQGEPPDQRPVAIPDEVMQRPDRPYPPDRMAPPDRMQPPPGQAPYELPPVGTGAPPQGPPPAFEAAGYGQLAVRAQPAGAQIFIDGEAWQGPEGAERLLVNLPAGTHTVEIRKDGFNTFRTEVRIEDGQVVPLNVSLSGREEQ